MEQTPYWILRRVSGGDWHYTHIGKESPYMYNGRFQKISVPYHGRLLGIPRARGGLFELEFRRHGGILTSGILEAWGG